MQSILVFATFQIICISLENLCLPAQCTKRIDFIIVYTTGEKKIPLHTILSNQYSVSQN